MNLIELHMLQSFPVTCLNRDQFVRTEFWSLPDELEYRMREAVGDPETAGTARVREMYKESGVKPKKNPWWKFW